MKFSKIFESNFNGLIDEYSFFKSFYSKHSKENDREDLLEHSKKTIEFFINFATKRNLDNIFDAFSISKEGIDILKKQIIEIIFLHDFGKLNPYFQETCAGDDIKNINAVHADHSFILLVLKYWDEIKELNSRKLRKKLEENKEEIYQKYYLFLFCYCVSLHHTNLSKTVKHEDIIIKIKSIIESKSEITQNIIESMPDNIKNKYNDSFKQITEFFKEKDLMILLKDEQFEKELFFNSKLFYSLIVLSDYYATYSYQFNRGIEEIEIRNIDEVLLKKIETNFYQTKSYNTHLKNIENLKIKQLEKIKNNINELRNNLIIESSQNMNHALKENSKRVFMLNVPTGGGKTNISLKLALDILNEKKEINRMFWVFPYINIIEQNSGVIRDTYFNDGNMAKKNVSQIYYDAIDLINVSSEEEYENNILQIIENNLNLKYINNPINIISNVNFFNAFFKSKKQNRYKCANFVNSVFVIDEIQSLKTEYLDLFYNLLEVISKQYNIYFIIMSATLPNINHYINKEIAVELIPDSKDYFSHPVFKRNSFEIISIENNFLSFFDTIIKKHKDQSKFLLVFNTIKTSIKIFGELYDKYLTQWKIFLLNSYITKGDRNKIINYIKNSDEKIILVSTQSIEAGVDLDFDVAIRDKAILDSIEQVAGRVNREADINKSKNSKVYIIDYENESRIYNSDDRFSIIKEDISGKGLHILNNRLFDDYYKEYFQKILEKQSKAKIMKFDYEVQNFNFKEIHKLNLIDKKIQSLRLIFENLTSDIIKELDEIKLFENCRTINQLLNLKENKSGFKWQPYIEIINKIIQKNSIELKLYNPDKKAKFISFLHSKEYYVSELGDSIIIKNKFKEDYFKSYDLDKKDKVSYFDINRLMNEDFKNFNDCEGIFL